MSTAHMKVGTRLIIGFGLVLLMSVSIIVLCLIKFSSIGELSDKVAHQDWVKAEAANNINAAARANARRTLELLIAKDEAHVARIQERMEANKKVVNESLEILDKLVVLPEAKTLLEQIKAARSQYVSSFTKVGKLLAEGKKEEAIALVNTETLLAVDALQEPILALADLEKKVVMASNEQVQQDVSFARTLMLILGGISLIVGITTAVLITRGLRKQLGGEPDYAAAIAGKIAAGDLSVDIDISNSDRASLLVAMKAMRDSLVNIVGQVRVGTETIATASGQIASGNLDLSSRTEEQASSLEETASSMEELTSTVKQNADNARQANGLAVTASEVAMKGGAVVSEVVQTMGSINESAKKIVDIIGVIDGIAFQTNILALNAAVEAARAGEQGRGFAVVASEVRNLAQRSAAAAKEIKTLIGDSVEKVDMGSRLVDQAGATMQEVVESIRRVTDIMAEISAASQEQTAGIEQINQAITQMDEVTQQNASLVEEAAAASEAMQEQAGNLAQVVSVFKLDGVHGAAIAASTRAATPVRATVALPRKAKAVSLAKAPSRSRATPVPLSARHMAAARTGTDGEWEQF